MARIQNYLSLVKFSHTIFALPFALIGFFLGTTEVAESWSWVLLIKVVLCMVFARTSAMAFNRYADRDIDQKNDRTMQREIPGGIISPNKVLSLVIISSLLFIAVTFTINTLCFYLSPVALAVILGYSYTKRFTWLCHVILGIGLSLAPIGAYLAVTGSFDWTPLLFSCIVITWVSGFDVIYSLQDEAFDRDEQLYSMPSAFGKKGALRISNLLHMLSGILIISAGVIAHFHFIYWVGAVVFIGLLFYQHLLVKPDDLSKVNLAFFTTNGIASLVFAIFVITDLLYFR